MVIYHNSCGFVVYNGSGENRKYLLLRYPEGHWDFPKGHIEEGEDKLQTAIRELEEETGLKKVKVVKGFFCPISYSYRRDKTTHKKTVDFFLAQSLSKKIIISHEHSGHDWLDFKSAVKKVTFDNAKEVLRAAETFLAIR